ncbi:three component ABC system middle component [Kitasatospora sp. NPDC088346]|uniref:three component ABC system middle component n=1 Tax=Kitasatospora sp. NPDC088346 TaxID=3364073 RepID=UPI003830DF90
MPSWGDRPQAGAVFLNPALLAAVQASAARAYERESGGRLIVWPLSFIIAPLVLHRPTRQALPSSVRTHLSSWVSEHPVLVAGLPARTSSLLPAIREGMRFGIRHRMLAVEHGAVRGLLGGAGRSDGELAELLRAAALAGRWMTRTDNPSTVFALLGMRP